MTDDQISVDQVADAVHVAAFVDSREPAEFERGHIRGAVLMPMERLAARIESGRSVENGTR